MNCNIRIHVKINSFSSIDSFNSLFIYVSLFVKTCCTFASTWALSNSRVSPISCFYFNHLGIQVWKMSMMRFVKLELSIVKATSRSERLCFKYMTATLFYAFSLINTRLIVIQSNLSILIVSITNWIHFWISIIVKKLDILWNNFLIWLQQYLYLIVETILGRCIVVSFVLAVVAVGMSVQFNGSGRSCSHAYH